MITPDCFSSIPCPTYPEIRLALFAGRKMKRLIEEARPAALHIATEGPLGLAARRYCLQKNIPFTTAFHTRFAEYVNARIRVPLRWGYAALKWFHRPSSALMVATQSLEQELSRRGFGNMVRWTRGIDTDLFRPDRRSVPSTRGEGPVFLYVGRVSVEKNIEAFLSLDLPGRKIVVGDGPARQALTTKYPDVVFAGVKGGEELATLYADADVFVFPSKTDTFGLVLLEALASGVPVAAYPVTGPLDVIGDSPAGVLRENLQEAALAALKVDRNLCRDHALRFSWEISAAQFRENLFPFDPARHQKSSQ